MRRRDVRRREARILTEEIRSRFGFRLRYGRLEVVEAGWGRLYVFDGSPLLFEREGSIYPTLAFLEVVNSLPKVTVDMGAVPALCRGADVMAPGVVKVEGDFNPGDLVAVVDERYRKTLALGLALKDSSSVRSSVRGKVVKNIHYVGDKIWDTMKKV